MESGKRKRDSGKSENPRKRVAVDVPEGRDAVKVSVIRDDAGLGPVVASTPGLSIPSDFPLTPYKKEGKKRGYELLLQSSAHPKLDYLGREEQLEKADAPMKDYVGVYDPATGSLQLMEAHKLVVRTTLRKETEEMRTLREDARAQRVNSRYELGLQFGSARTVKAITARTQNIITPQQGKDGSNDAMTKAVLSSVATTTADMPSQDMMQATIDENKPRPVPDLAANNPAEVYPLETLLPHGALQAIEVKDWIDAIKAQEDVKTTSQYVAHRLKVLAETNQVRKLKALRYILLLLNFNASLRNKGRGPKQVLPREKLLEKLEVPSPIIDAMLRKFSAGREMSKWHQDNLATHVCAIALYIDDYEVDFYDLHSDLHLEMRELQQYFIEIGCRVSLPTEPQRQKANLTKAEAASHKIAKLKLPLNFPKTRTRATAKRR